MPKYEDLQYLKNKIIKLGKEEEILAGKGKELKIDPLPEKVETIEDSYNDLLDESLLDDISNEISAQKPQLIDDIPDFLDSEPENINDNQFNDLDNLDSFDDTAPADSIDDDLSALLAPEPEDAIDNHFDDIDNLDNFDENTPDDSIDDDLSALLAPEPEDAIDNDFDDTDNLDSFDNTSPVDDGLSSLLEPQSQNETFDDFDTAVPDDFGSLLGNMNLGHDDSSNEISDFDTSNNGLVDMMGPLDDIDTTTDDAISEPDDDLLSLSSLDDLPDDSEDENSDQMNSGLDDFSLSDMNEKHTDDSLLDFSSLDNLDDLDALDTPVESINEDPVDLEEFDPLNQNIPDSSEEAQPELESLDNFNDVYENSEKNTSSEITFTDEERTNIFLALSTFPKDAEIKLAKAIVSDKYTDTKKLSLIKALINHESQQTICKLYQKLTSDNSLERIGLKKFTGGKFEERQKSFLYNFEKNILPTLSRIASILVIFMLFAAFYYFILEPTLYASKHYKIGKKNIEKLLFSEVEPNFNKAWSKQPRYGEIISFARKYREYERYLDAEKKYSFAVEYRKNNSTDLEFADFYREVKKYEKSISAYRNIIDNYPKNVEARIGMGKTYYDWSNEEISQIDLAEARFLDALDIDKKNFDAINYLLLTYIKKDNKKLVRETQKYLDLHYPKKVDPFVYTKLASFMIDNKMIGEVKEVLEKATISHSTNTVLPELDYQFARYNRSLNIADQEKFYLENASKKLDIIKKSDIKKHYPDTEFIRLRAKIYNDLGENYYNQSKNNIRAEELFNRSIASDPDYAKPYYNLGNFAYVTKGNREEALNNYEDSEKRGFTNDIQDYNLGWLYYKADRYYDSYIKINKLLNKNPDNNNLKFLLGTTLHKLGKYDLSQSTLLETYDRFSTLKQANSPMDMDIRNHQYIVEMVYRSANNLGASLEKKYEQTKKSAYLIQAHNFYAISIENYDRFTDKRDTASYDIEKDQTAGISRKNIKTVPHLNLKMSLYPNTPVKDDPIVYEDFNPMEFMK